MSKFRESRSSSIPDEDLMKPMQFLKLGGDDDPCFGKEYDLNAHECQLCGDIEACAIAFSQSMKKIRKGEEKKATFKDLDAGALEARLEVEKFIQKKQKAGVSDARIRIMIKKKYQFTTKQIKTLFQWT